MDYPEGLDAQYLENSQAAAAHGYVIPNTPEFRFSDNDVTGVSKSRVGFDRLLAVVRSGAGTGERVYVRNKKRLGRFLNPKMHNYFEVEFEQCGAPIVYSAKKQQPINYETDRSANANGEFLQDQLDSMRARDERLETMEEINKGMRSWAINGFYPLTLPYYGTCRWLADSRTKVLIERVPNVGTVSRESCRYRLVWETDGSVQVVKEIYAWIEEGKSLHWIAATLTARGTPAPGARYLGRWPGGNRWYAPVIVKIARNPIYAGDFVLGRTSQKYRDQDAVPKNQAKLNDFGKLLVPDFMEDPPIPRAQWKAVQEILDGNVRTKAGRKVSGEHYVLTGLLSCSLCGQVYTGFTKLNRRDGTPTRYYRHDAPRNSHSNACAQGIKYVRADQIEPAVEGLVRSVLRKDTLSGLVSAETSRMLGDSEAVRREGEALALQTQLAELKCALDRANLAYVSATSPSDIESLGKVKADLSAKVDELSRQVKAIAADAAQLRTINARHVAHVEETTALVAGYHTATTAEKKRILSFVIERISVDGTTRQIAIAVRAA